MIIFDDNYIADIASVLNGPYGILRLLSGADGSAHGQTLALEANSFDPDAVRICLHCLTQAEVCRRFVRRTKDESVQGT